MLLLQETANVTPINVDDPDQICDLLEQAIKNNSQLKYKEKGYDNDRRISFLQIDFCLSLEVALYIMYLLKMIGVKSS